MTVRLFVVAMILCLVGRDEQSFAQLAASGSSLPTSYVQGTGAGTVTLKPTRLRLSIPIKVVEEASWDATEKLREIRQQIVDRANEMGVIEGSLKSVGFHCGNEATQASVFAAANRTGETEPKFAAKCFLVADFRMGQLDDFEAMVAMSQSQLQELASLVPKQAASRSSYSYSTLTSGLSTQQLETPLAFFVADVSDEHRAAAYKAALDQADRQVTVALKALGVDSNLPIAINQHTSYSSSRNAHPAEAAIFPPDKSEAVSLYPDGVTFAVRLNVIARFDAPK